MSIRISVKSQKTTEVPLVLMRRRQMLFDHINNYPMNLRRFNMYHEWCMSDSEIAAKMTDNGLPMNEDDVRCYRESRQLPKHGRDGESRVDELSRLYGGVVESLFKGGSGVDKIRRHILNRHGVAYSRTTIAGALAKLGLVGSKEKASQDDI